MTSQTNLNSPALSPTTLPEVDPPIASTNSGSLSISITLAEPILFLQGFERSEYTQRMPAMLRGTLHVQINKPTKIKAINLSFAGKARTEWPEGIPPAKDEFSEEKELISHLWPCYNAHFTPDPSFGADRVVDSNGDILPDTPSLPSLLRERERSSSLGRRSFSTDRLANGSRRSSSRSRNDSMDDVTEAASKGYKMFPPGQYMYNFELAIDSSLPESIECNLGWVRYELEASIERPGAFKSKLNGKKSVTLIRTPAESSLESGEPIVVSRNWEDQLHYDIVIGGKAFPIGSTIPVAFKLTPLAKVRCHRIRIMVTENTEYFCRNKKVHRIEPVRKYLLYEYQPESGSGSDNLLGDLDDGAETAGPIEFELNAKIPGCNVATKESRKLHPDTTYGNIKVHHWIKVVLRLSKTDINDPSKRRHFEVSIDSPFHLLSCRCTTANVSLPVYDKYGSSSSAALPPCPCMRLANEPEQPVEQARPIHLLRRPSVNPPPFDADTPPPLLVTPPPGYDDVIGPDGYFGNAGNADEDDDSDRDVPIGFNGLSLNESTTSFESRSSGSSESSGLA
ncbi:hypothetical protein V1512DRAFT_209740 [Lipomyces arxii]|uniref:uncharacterized protein n=1 Tax=Lipomyces arxii TaxID=56418 RepID=UPI0034CDDFDD